MASNYSVNESKPHATVSVEPLEQAPTGDGMQRSGSDLWEKLRVAALKTSEAVDTAAEVVWDWFGMNESKFQEELDHYNAQQEAQREAIAEQNRVIAERLGNTEAGTMAVKPSTPTAAAH